MEKMNQALERMKMLVGMEVDDDEEQQQQQESSYIDDFNRNCTLSTKQVSNLILDCLFVSFFFVFFLEFAIIPVAMRWIIVGFY